MYALPSNIQQGCYIWLLILKFHIPWSCL